MVTHSHFHPAWVSSCWLSGVSLWAGVRHFFLWLRTRLPEGLGGCALDSVRYYENRGPSRSPQLLLVQEWVDPWPQRALPSFFTLLRWLSWHSLAYSASCQTPGPVLALVVIVEGWRGPESRSPSTISHYFTTESSGHAAQPAVTQDQVLYSGLRCCPESQHCRAPHFLTVNSSHVWCYLWQEATPYCVPEKWWHWGAIWASFTEHAQCTGQSPVLYVHYCT